MKAARTFGAATEAPLTLLLAEDNAADVGLVRLALQELAKPVELFVVDDGVKALEFLRREAAHADAPQPDFVLLDLKLPRKGGLEVLSEIKRDPALRRIPVIVLTSSTVSGDIGRAYELQAAAYFAKPVSGLHEVVAAILAFVGAAQRPGESPGAAFRTRSGVYPALPAEAGELGELPREDQLAALVASAADALIGVGLDGTITSWNRAAEELFGQTEEEAVGQDVRFIAPEPERAGLVAALASVRAGTSVPSFGIPRVNRRGRTIDVSASMAPVRDGQGNVIGVVLVGHDVTERALLEHRFRTAVEHSPSAIVMVDARGRIVLLNAETERLFGYPRAALLGRSVDILVPERFRALHPRHRTAFMLHPEARAMGSGRHLFGLRSDGVEFPVEIGFRPISTPEGMLVLSAIVDISERKRAEDGLSQQARELARSNAELEQFVYVAAHDLQEPLRTVASYTQLLERRYGDRFDGDARSYLAFARDGAVRMQGLLDALLTYSRFGTTGRALVPTNTSEALDAALQNLRAAVEQSGAEIVRGELPTVAGDPTQLVELFQNLVGNAIKFRGSAPPRVEIAAHRGERAWEFLVRDNGIGIDPAYLDRIFQVFQRLHTNDEHPGTGIGLAICKRIVERLGGRLWVESLPGAGATFRFTVPDPVESTATAG